MSKYQWSAKLFFIILLFKQSWFYLFIYLFFSLVGSHDAVCAKFRDSFLLKINIEEPKKYEDYYAITAWL